MKKISIWLLGSSVIFYLLFYFILWDAPHVVSIPSFLICLGLAVANLVISIIALTGTSLDKKVPIWLAIVMFLINAPVFLFFSFYILTVFFVPLNFQVG